MPERRRKFSWKVTRLLFSSGTMAIFFGLARLGASSEPYLWILIIVGIALVAVSTRGPWDSDASGRNRSVLGFHARPEKKQITSKL